MSEDRSAALRARLLALGSGRVPPVAVTDVEALLASSWPELEGGGAGGMVGWKVIGRTERATWSPPSLEFELERHGGAAIGSKYADVQSWAVDVEARTATLCGTKRRLLRPLNSRVNAAKIAAQIGGEICDGADADYLEWKVPGELVTVVLGRIDELASGAAKTLEGRRRKFGPAIEAYLSARGWTREPSSRMVCKRAFPTR